MPYHLWTTKCVPLHNSDSIVLGEGIYYSIKFDLIVGSMGSFGDTYVAVQISRSLKLDEFLDDWRYSNQAWPIIYVFYNSVSFLNHEKRHKFNC